MTHLPNVQRSKSVNQHYGIMIYLSTYLFSYLFAYEKVIAGHALKLES